MKKIGRYRADDVVVAMTERVEDYWMPIMRRGSVSSDGDDRGDSRSIRDDDRTSRECWCC